MEEIFLICLGLVFGSFLNVVIHRLPLGRSIVRPGSACPDCGAGIRFYDNIPVVSYLVLRGKCRECGSRISVRYPLVELFTAFSFWLAHRYFADEPLHLAMTLVFLCLLIALALIDFDHMILPDELTIGGGIGFLIYAFFNPALSVWNAWGTALGTSLFFILLYLVYLRVRKIEGLGLGDVKMVVFLGAFLGLEKCVIALLLASLSGLIVGLFLIVFRKKDLKFALPFGTFLALGSYISVFWGDDIFLTIQLAYR